MKNVPEMLASANRGFVGELEPDGMFSSPIWLAWCAGRALARDDRPAPLKCAMSRGFDVRVLNDDGEHIVKISGKYLERHTVVRK